MPERKRIVRFEIVFSCIPFLLRLSQIVEPEPEPHPRPPRIRLKIYYGFRTLSPSVVSPTNPDLCLSNNAHIPDYIRLFYFYAAVEFIQRQRADDPDRYADYVDNGRAC